MSDPVNMPIVDLDRTAEDLGRAGERVRVLWQEGESLAFIARGREYRSEFHLNPSDEVMLMIRGQMNLHYRNPDGSEDVAVI
ncbi:MAG: 3-hydroxybutyryl-CoA dehydratase, partial [Pseudonocardia sp.]|nr:3-hydroxybutyryl-CoA dehydratase [Pseudonocardia sp.]